MLKYLLFILLLVRISVSAQPVTLTCFDLLPGSLSSVPQYMASCNGKMLFECDGDTTAGQELWVSDGTRQGTRLLKDINTGSRGSWPVALSAAKDKIFFLAAKHKQNGQLWASDGTDAGTYQVSGIDTNNIFGGAAVPVTVFNNQAFFWGSDSAQQQCLWVSDGTTQGTHTVVSFAHDRLAQVNEFAIYRNKVYFLACFQSGIGQLWGTDGTTAGTALVDSFSIPLSLYMHISSCNDQLYFTGTDNTHGIELWTSDGTKAGTHMLKDIWTGTQNGCMGAGVFAYNDLSYFYATDGSNTGLYATDGTADGTRFIANTAALFGEGTMVICNNLLYFMGDSAALHVTDGTTAGTHFIRDSAGELLRPQLLGNYKNHVYILTAEGAGHGLYRLGNGDTVELLKMGQLNSTSLYFAKQFFEFDDALWVNDWLDSSGAELWRIYDTTTVVQQPKKPFAIYPNPNHGSFTINTADSNFTGRIHICDVAGREVYYNNHVSGSIINVTIPGAATGVYFLTMQDISDPKTSRTISSYKIVVW